MTHDNIQLALVVVWIIAELVIRAETKRKMAELESKISNSAMDVRLKALEFCVSNYRGITVKEHFLIVVDLLNGDTEAASLKISEAAHLEQQAKVVKGQQSGYFPSQSEQTPLEA